MPFLITALVIAAIVAILAACIKIVPQAHEYVIEFLGKYKTTWTAGIHFKIPVLAQAPGGFLVYGIVVAIMNKLTEKRGGVKRKSFSCEGCPTAHLCNKSSCDEANEAVKEGAENA